MVLGVVKGYHIDRLGCIHTGKFDLTKWFETQPFTTRCSYDSSELEERLRPFVMECLPAGLSAYGFHCVDRSFALWQEKEEWYTLAHELTFEMVRLQRYPKKPSRLSCLYACPEENLAQHFSSLKAYDFPDMQVAELQLPESENEYHIGDSSWLDNIQSVVGGIYNARHYWEGHPRHNPPYFNKPAWEYLLSGQVKVNRLLPPEEIQAILNKYP